MLRFLRQQSSELIFDVLFERQRFDDREVFSERELDPEQLVAEDGRELVLADFGIKVEIVPYGGVDVGLGDGDAALAGDEAGELLALDASDRGGDAVDRVVEVEAALGDVRLDATLEMGVGVLPLADLENDVVAGCDTVRVVTVGDEKQGEENDDPDSDKEQDALASFGVDFLTRKQAGE